MSETTEKILVAFIFAAALFASGYGAGIDNATSNCSAAKPAGGGA